MQFKWLSAMIAVCTLPLLAGAAPPPSEAQLHHCLVSLIEDVQIPAEVAGVLVKINAKEGDQFEPGAPLVQINEDEARFQRDLALAEEKVSREKADDDVNVRYADAARKVAQAEYDLNKAANEQHKGTVPVVKMQELWLKVRQAELQIEKATHEQTIARYETAGYKAKVDVADEQVRKRKITAPIKGEVVEVMFREGEWVEPGNPVLRIVRLDRLRIEGFLNIKDFSPSEVGKRRIHIVVPLARGRLEKFDGTITFVNPLVQAGGEYRVWAEVVNRQENGEWLLRPGLEAEMTIDVGALAARPADAR
jgi:multidrug efflux pump subunit AcrA (membrane-fusion protein)